MKKKNGKEEMVLVMIGGGDESMFIKVPKGSKISTSYGYIIAGETYEENRRRYEDRFNALIKRIDEENARYNKHLLKEQKPDFSTLLYLMLDNTKIVAHPEVFDLDSKRKLDITPCTTREAYVFKNFDEYKKYFLMYLNDVNDEEIINFIICTSKKGHVVASKMLCQKLIVEKVTDEFYKSFTQEQIDDIHSRGKLTPREFVQQCFSFGVCAPRKTVENENSRCKFFPSCYTCLLEYATHKNEYSPIHFESISFNEKGKARSRNNN